MTRPLRLAALFLALAIGPAARAADEAAPAAATATAGLRIEMFAMGQADAMLILGPERSVLVDCGAPIDGPKDGYKRVAAEIRRASGRPHVDALVITHFHSDHTGLPASARDPASGIWGLFAEGITVTAILDHGDAYPSFGRETYPHEQFVASLEGWKKAGVFEERRVPVVGERLELGGGAAIRFVAVNGNGALERLAKKGRFDGTATPSENDYSIAIVASLGAFELYAGGDLGGERYRAHSGGRGKRDKRHEIYSDVEVLRVDHHGSSHSTNEGFVATLRPEVALISCGGGNAFHHPAREVVDRLRPFGPVFVTSGLAREWAGVADAPKVLGDIVIAVASDGASYTIAGHDGTIVLRGRSWSDEEEAKGLDHPPGASPELPPAAHESGISPQNPPAARPR
jgi:competence protein ComEC